MNALSAIVGAKFLYVVVIFKSSVCSDARFQPIYNCSEDLVEKLKQINEFPTLFYVPAWMKSSVGTDVAFENLTFLQDLITYKNFARTIAERAFKKLANLKCFLSEETVVFAIFSDNSRVQKQKQNRKSLQETSRHWLR